MQADTHDGPGGTSRRPARTWAAEPGPSRDILAVAAELFAAKGVASTTVRDIGAAAGVHSGSLYHYFPSKEVIAVELPRTFVSNLGDHFAAIAALPEPLLQRLRTMVHTTLTIINEHPHETRMFRQDYQYPQDRGVLGGLDPDLPVLRTHWVVLDEGMADGSLRSDIPWTWSPGSSVTRCGPPPAGPDRRRCRPRNSAIIFSRHVPCIGVANGGRVRQRIARSIQP